MRDIDAAIDAGVKACDLYEIAKNDIIRRVHLRRFLEAALAELEKPKPKRRAR